jgi:beta-glucosidase
MSVAAWDFPEGFLWGAATAAYQIEGGATEAGRGASIWDTFSHTPGAVAGGDTGDVATDHYHRFLEDVDLIASLKLAAYRFSISWPRIQPDGRGPANAAGLAFYDQLVDALLARGVTPAVTLYHWDLPQALEDAGGWPSRDTASRFADYAQLVHGALGDRVDLWTTLNEPWCSAFLGYLSGRHAPGRRDPSDALAAMHHLLLGHGLAVQGMRSEARDEERFAITVNLSHVIPATDGDDDLAAAHLVDGLQNRVFLEPLLRGSYPQDVVDATSAVSGWEFVHADDVALINQPLDLLGLNYYFPIRVAADPTSPGLSGYPGTAGIRGMAPQGALTDMGWERSPQALTSLLVRLGADYSVPIMVTENGAAFPDVLQASGRVDDRERTAFLKSHLRAVHEAIGQGVDVRGYFAWSLLDNFEWAEGYAKRFGLVYVDYETLERHPKDSARWYAEVARGNRLA